MKKSSRSNPLPKYVYVKRENYIYRPYVKGDPRRSYVIGPVTMQISKVWEWFELFTEERQATDNLDWLLHEYKNSEQFTHKLDGTPKSTSHVKTQLGQIERILSYPCGNTIFGKIPRNKIQQPTIRTYLDARAKEGSAVAGNRDKALISAAWNWALERGKITEPNPCKGVKRNPEKPRERFVTDEEYSLVLKLAQEPERAWYLAPAMELAFLMRGRNIEILTLKRNQITAEGIELDRAKGSRKSLIEWSPRLRRIIDQCFTQHSISSLYVLSDKNGQAIKQSAFSSCWQRLMNNAVTKYGIERFTYHDLKAKGVSDYDGDKQEASGHKTLSQVNVYNRKRQTSKSTK